MRGRTGLESTGLEMVASLDCTHSLVALPGVGALLVSGAFVASVCFSRARPSRALVLAGELVPIVAVSVI